MNIVTMAVPLSGNRGSSSMLLSIVQNLDKRLKDVHYDVFTYYPKVDTGKNPFPHVSIWSGTPLNILLRLVPLSFLYFLCSLVGIKPRALLPRDLKAILDCDLYLAVGGTTFNDAKLLKVGFNVLCLLPAVFLRRRLVLYTQTMGPFKNPFNRLMAKLTLPYAELVIGRGKGSHAHLAGLGLKNISYATDAAFSLAGASSDRSAVERYGEALRGKRTVGVSPNSIVAGYCLKKGIPHAQIFGGFINRLIAAGYFPVLIPHSIKPQSQNKHNNDLPIIADILKHVDKPDALLFIPEDYTYLELRELIGTLDFYVASRFHAMISALYTKRPVLVVGWGYQKYSEIMAEFELEDYFMGFKDMDEASLWEGFQRIVRDQDKIVAKIEANLPKVVESSAKAAERVAELLEGKAS